MEGKPWRCRAQILKRWDTGAAWAVTCSVMCVVKQRLSVYGRMLSPLFLIVEVHHLSASSALPPLMKCVLAVGKSFGKAASWLTVVVESLLKESEMWGLSRRPLLSPHALSDVHVGGVNPTQVPEHRQGAVLHLFLKPGLPVWLQETQSWKLPGVSV